MVKNLEKKILWLIVIFFISPYGLGFTFIPGLQSLDLPKIIPLLFFIIVAIKFDFKKVYNSILILLMWLRALIKLYLVLLIKDLQQFLSCKKYSGKQKLNIILDLDWVILILALRTIFYLER